ncbi:MAG: sirohydrochlorin cobaltochelatase [Pseudoflavonifractor sp.]
MNRDKKALLAVSFGTSHLDTLARTIGAIENDLAGAFPDYNLRRAFTSAVICRKLAGRDGLRVDSVTQALAGLEAEGYGQVLVQPTHIIGGEEYEKLLAQAAPFRGRFQSLRMGAPLLTGLDDYYAVARALCGGLPPPDRETVHVFMGHGSSHWANPAYPQLEYICHDLGRKDLLIATVEGYPDFAALLRRLQERPGLRNIHLAPLMIVAGDHAKNDLAGEDPGSWRSRLTALGYACTCRLQGLGECPEIRAVFRAHAQAAAERG